MSEMSDKMVFELTDEEINKLDLPFSFNTVYYEIGREANALTGKQNTVAYPDIFIDEDGIWKIEHLKKEFGKTIFLTQEEADNEILSREKLNK